MIKKYPYIILVLCIVYILLSCTDDGLGEIKDIASNKISSIIIENPDVMTSTSTTLQFEYDNNQLIRVFQDTTQYDIRLGGFSSDKNIALFRTRSENYTYDNGQLSSLNYSEIFWRPNNSDTIYLGDILVTISSDTIRNSIEEYSFNLDGEALKKEAIKIIRENSVGMNVQFGELGKFIMRNEKVEKVEGKIFFEDIYNYSSYHYSDSNLDSIVQSGERARIIYGQDADELVILERTTHFDSYDDRRNPFNSIPDLILINSVLLKDFPFYGSANNPLTKTLLARNNNLNKFTTFYEYQYDEMNLPISINIYNNTAPLPSKITCIVNYY